MSGGSWEGFVDADAEEGVVEPDGVGGAAGAKHGGEFYGCAAVVGATVNETESTRGVAYMHIKGDVELGGFER